MLFQDKRKKFEAGCDMRRRLRQNEREAVDLYCLSLTDFNIGALLLRDT